MREAQQDAWERINEEVETASQKTPNRFHELVLSSFILLKTFSKTLPAHHCALLISFHLYSLRSSAKRLYLSVFLYCLPRSGHHTHLYIQATPLIRRARPVTIPVSTKKRRRTCERNLPKRKCSRFSWIWAAAVRRNDQPWNPWNWVLRSTRKLCLPINTRRCSRGNVGFSTVSSWYDYRFAENIWSFCGEVQRTNSSKMLRKAFFRLLW